MNKTAALLAAAALTAPVALSAQTIDLPPRKAGLWEITTSIEKPKAMPAFTAQACLDPATDKEMMEHGLKMSGACKKMTSRREGKTIVIDADCTASGMATRSRTVISGDFQASYTVRSEGTMEGEGGKGQQAMLMTQTGTWKGADCPGMKPGDMTMFGGIKVNIKQIKALSGMIRGGVFGFQVLGFTGHRCVAPKPGP
jgi:hypothetical protein